MKSDIVRRLNRKEGEEMQEHIKKLSNYIMEDIEAVRNREQKPDERLGIEVMTLNALCNADRTLKVSDNLNE